MSFVAGLLRGFNASSQRGREEARAEQDKQDAKEEKILGILAQSDDAEVSNAAITASLQRASGVKPPKGGFLASLMGPQTQVHPAVASLLKLVNTPHQETVEGLSVAEGPMRFATPPPAAAPAPTTPKPQGFGPHDEGGPQTPPAPQAAPPGSAAMAPPPTPGSITAAPGAPAGGNAMVGAPPPASIPVGGSQPLAQPNRPISQMTVTTPRKLFLSTTERALAGAKAKAQGDVEGEVAGLVASGFSDQQARDLIKEKYERQYRGTSAGSIQSIQGEDAQGNVVYALLDKRPTSPTFGKYIDADNGAVIPDFRPRATTSSVSMGSDKEAASMRLYGKRYGDPSLTSSQRAQADALANTLAGQKVGSQTGARMGAEASGPLAVQQRFQATRDMRDEWTTAQKPVQEMGRQFQLMQIGLDRFTKGDKIGGSQAVLVTFQKILDPTSVVRESEYARSPEGLGLLQRLEGAYQRLTEGGAGVPVEELAAMVETAKQMTEQMADYNAAKRATIAEQARQYGIEPSLVFGEVGTPPPSTAPITGGRTAGAASPADGPPQVGQVVGNIYTGERRTDPTTHKVYGLIDGQPRELTLVNGKWYY